MNYKSLLLFSTLIVMYLSCSNTSTSSKETSLITKNNNIPYTCENGRFEKNIFDHLKMHDNVKYGRNTTMQNKTIDLKMDIFEPEDDTASLRPLVIWAHGGYFCFGDKSDFHGLCEFVAQKGWISASIDYRKWRKRQMPDQLEYMETAIRATHDMHAAIRFFKADAAGENLYRIDTTKIFVGGYSAGAIMAAQVAYLDLIKEVPSNIQSILKRNGGITGNSGHAQHSSSIAGSIVIAGAVYDKKMITEGAHPPFLGIQGTQDEIVPYRRGWAHSPMGTQVIELDGTAVINQINKDLGHPSTLLSLPRGDHNAAWEELWVERTKQYIHKFLLENTCQ
jgi:acetyl esterase/lipase